MTVHFYCAGVILKVQNCCACIVCIQLLPLSWATEIRMIFVQDGIPCVIPSKHSLPHAILRLLLMIHSCGLFQWASYITDIHPQKNTAAWFHKRWLHGQSTCLDCTITAKENSITSPELRGVLLTLLVAFCYQLALSVDICITYCCFFCFFLRSVAQKHC